MCTLSKCVSIYIDGVEVNDFWSIGDEAKKGEVSVSDIREVSTRTERFDCSSKH